MRNCIYCRKIKSDKEFTLEHVIPQFLGGAQAPDKLKTRDVCKICNSDLGLFVDAAFEKDFLVFNELKNSASAFFNPEKPFALPLKCMGTCDLIPPNMKENEICEAWLGSLGEQIYWIRIKDERMYWYSGGNPRTVKKVKSSAYFIFSDRSHKNPLLSWLTFKEAFAGRPAVKKIMCTEVEGADAKTIGFSEPDEIDKLRIQYIVNECKKGRARHSKVSIYKLYDVRFMAKLAIGISNILFGSDIGNSDYGKELHKALWFKEGNAEPKIQGAGALSSLNNDLKDYYGVAYGVTVTVLPTPEEVIINLNLNRKMNWVFVCAKLQDLTSEQVENLGNGICIVLFKSLNKGFKLSPYELIAHNLGYVRHPELEVIEQLANVNLNYFENL